MAKDAAAGESDAVRETFDETPFSSVGDEDFLSWLLTKGCSLDEAQMWVAGLNGTPNLDPSVISEMLADDRTQDLTAVEKKLREWKPRRGGKRLPPARPRG